MSSTYSNTEGLVIKKTPYAEADFLVRALTRDFGKIDILAKGARKSGAKLNAHLDMLNHIRLAFVQNGDRMPTLIDAEVVNRYDDWFLDADKVSTLGRALQTLDLMVPAGEKDQALFSMVLGFFRDAKATHTIGFLNKFFKHQGYGEPLDLSFLPSEISQSIMKIWPALKN